jgi:DNA replication protein DnaC
MKARLFEIVSDKDKFDVDRFSEVLESNSAIKDWAYILHDKDSTREHYHVAIRLRDSYDSKYVAQWFSVAENFVNRVKGRWSDMLKYLIHENAPEKYQYSIGDVISNFDWIKEKEKDDTSKKMNEIIHDIVDGNIREYNYYNHITIDDYNKYKRQIDNAFQYRKDVIKGVSRRMDCVFITGDSGVGKTTYAKQIAENKGYSVYVSSGSNDVLDDYKGQDCIILDDLRPSSMGLSDLLKMLDNHTASTVKSRYKNKVLECKMIIITTIQDIDTFFNNVFAEDIETSIQLKRRCETHVRMDRDYVYVKMWQKKSRKYGEEFKTPNPITLQHDIEDMSKEEQLDKLSEVLGGFKAIVDEVRSNPEEYEQIDIDDVPFEHTK